MEMRKSLSLGLVMALALGTLGLAGCTGSQTEEGGKDGALTGSLSVEGSDTMVNLGQAWAEAFAEVEPGVMVTVKGGGSGNGAAALANGTVHFANMSREIKDEEVEAAEAAGVEPAQHVVAKDGISVIVHPSNPVTDLTVEQIGKIYRGEIANWSEVGGPDKKIVLLARDTSSGTYEFFKEAVVGKDAEYAQSTLNLGSNQQIVDEAKGNEGAIGYVGLGYAANAGSAIKVLTVAGIEATVDNVQGGSYPLGRDLYMYSAGELDAAGQAYLDWIVGEEGQAIVEEEGFVPLS